MRITWKSKNPYLNLLRETNKVISSTLSDSQKLKNITFILSKDYSGLWLFSHPSHKFLGDKIPDNKDLLDNNPYFNLLSFMRDNYLKEDFISLLERELSWIKHSNYRLDDWAVTG